MYSERNGSQFYSILSLGIHEVLIFICFTGGPGPRVAQKDLSWKTYYSHIAVTHTNPQQQYHCQASSQSAFTYHSKKSNSPRILVCCLKSLL